MTTKRIALWCGVLLLLASPVVAYQFWEEFLQMLGIQFDSVAVMQDPRVQERVEFLQKQTLDESFAELLESQQYYSPGYHPAAKGVPRELETLLSARSFLKVFQQFLELPKDRAYEKLIQFCDRAIKEYEALLEQVRLVNSGEFDPDTSYHAGNAKDMLCATMLLAARIGENEYLLHLIDQMQSLADSYAERDDISSDEATVYRLFFVLEDDCLFSVLMYALKRTRGDLEIDMPDTIIRKIIPLFRWNADATHYDFLVQYGGMVTNPDDLVEQIDVYAFPVGFDDQQKKTLIATLKECLSK